MKAIERAAEIGKQAFLDGKKDIPYLDKNIQNLVKGKTLEQTIPLFRAWLKGWNTLSNIDKKQKASFIKTIASKNKVLAKKVSKVLNK